MRFDEGYGSSLEERIFQEARECKENGMKVVGVYCAFTPKELISAAGAIPVSLCAGSEQPFEKAHLHLPQNLCPIVKASYGHALADTCPYFGSADFLVADATCDGKKKMYELLGRIKPLRLLHLPQTAQGRTSLSSWEEELKGMLETMENLTGRPITRDDLFREIALYNRYRAKKKEVFELNTGEVPLVFGSEVDVITWPSMFDINLEARIREMDEAMAVLRARAGDGDFLEGMRTRPRILLTGCPITNKKLLKAIEECGGVVAAMENCGGLKTLDTPVASNGNPLNALAERYLSTACSCMTPNTARLEIIRSIIRRYRIDGVVELTWEACHTYNIEAFFIREFVQAECGRPYIQIRTDYSENDIEQIRTRIGAFLEMITSRDVRKSFH